LAQRPASSTPATSGEAIQRSALLARLSPFPGNNIMPRLFPIVTLLILTGCYTGDPLTTAEGPWEEQLSISDDGTSTTIIFPRSVAMPAPTKLGNPVKGCGPDGDESIVDFSVHTDPTSPDGIRKMVIAATAPGWCLRRDKSRVYEVRNLGYDLNGHSTGTGTISPNVIREVNGSPDAK